MKKIGIISDTHGGLANIRQCVKIAGSVECWFHLGDYARDAAELQKLTDKPVYAVRGNCDGFSGAPLERVVEIFGKRFLLIHGHTYRVNENLLQAVCRAEELNCSTLFFGHTHIALIDNNGGILIVNPGSARFPKDFKNPTFAVLTIDDGGMLRAEIIPISY